MLRSSIKSLLLLAATNCGGLTTSARGSVQSCMLRQARSRLPLLRARGSSAERASFEISVDLGEGSGIVDGDLPALFTRSELLTVRYPLPFALEAEPMQGVVKVVEAGNGLQVGDVLRACSTPELRYDSTQKRVCYGAGYRGTVPPAVGAKAAGRTEDWLGTLFQRATAELGGFAQTRPTKVLFVADGRPHQQVTDALTANTLERGVESIVMLFERPLSAPSDEVSGTGGAGVAGGAAVVPPAQRQRSFVPRSRGEPDAGIDDLGAALLRALNPSRRRDESDHII